MGSDPTHLAASARMAQEAALDRLRRLREGRDRWRIEAPQVVRQLRDAGVPLARIRAVTGVPKATVVRMSRPRRSSTTASGACPEPR